jgi:hypothetical protein
VNRQLDDFNGPDVPDGTEVALGRLTTPLLRAGVAKEKQPNSEHR